MSLDLYLQETANLAKQQSAILDEVRDMLQQGKALSLLEQGGVLRALQVLIENAIGKAKQILKQANEPVPTSAYDTMVALVRIGQLKQEQLAQWNAIIGLRNRIVHEYMNVDIEKVFDVVNAQAYHLVLEFLLAPLVAHKK